MDTIGTITKVVNITIEALSMLHVKSSKNIFPVDSKEISSLLESEKIIMIKYNLCTLLNNLSCYALIDQSTFVYSLVLVDLLVKKKLVTLNTLITSFIGVLLIALKMNQDLYRPKLFCLISGISLDNLEMIEAEILEKLQYKVSISADVYESYSFCLRKLNI